MSYARQSPSKQGKEAIEYCRDGKFDALYNKKSTNNENSCILMGEINMVPDEVIPYEDQMKSLWRHDLNPRHKNEVRRFIFSFAPDEIDCFRYRDGTFRDPNAPYKALEIVKAYCEETFPGRQFAFFVQADGKRTKIRSEDGRESPTLHVHAISNDFSLIDGKGFPTYQTDARWLAHSFADFVKDYVFENGEKFHVTKDQDKNLKALDAGYKPNRFHEKRIKESWFEKQRKDGDLPKFDENGLYNSYKDYLVDVITEAKGAANSFNEFEAFLSDRGIDIEQKSSKTKGNYLKYSVRSEYIYKKGADNSKAIIKAPKTNNASIGEAKLSSWAGADMGYTGIISAQKERDSVNKSSTLFDNEDHCLDQPEISPMIPLDVNDSHNINADSGDVDLSFEKNNVTHKGIDKQIKHKNGLQLKKSDDKTRFESDLMMSHESSQDSFNL